FEVFCTGKHEAFPSLNELKEPKILRHIRETVIEMMTLSQLSIDLAYSSVIFNSKEIAHEVATIEDNLEVLRGELEEHVLNYSKTAQNVKELRGLLRIATVSEKISDASKDIADILLSGIGLHPILLYAIKESDEVITRVEIQERSQLDGKSIAESEIEVETGMDIIALKKPKIGKWQFHPKGDHKLEAKDIIIAKGLKEGEHQLHNMTRRKGR
ncbi:MAG: potassium channel family protein, partial [Nitrososphaerales archaeon]